MSDFNPRASDAEPTRALVASDLKELLDRPIAYHRIFARVGGGPLAGIFLSQAIYWSQRTSDPNGWFYKTRTDWFLETELTRRHQETARRNLRDAGILEERLSGVPAQLYFRVNLDRLQKLITDLLDGKKTEQMEMPDSGSSKNRVPTSRAESAQQAGTKRANKKGAFAPSLKSETTPEISTENSSDQNDDEDFESLISDLTSHGVTKPQATKAVGTHAAELRRRLEFLPFAEVRTTAARFLMGNLDTAYFPPTGFKSAAQISAQKSIDDKRVAENELAGRLDAQRREAAENEVAALDAYFENLPTAIQAEILEQAKRRAPLVGNRKMPTETDVLIARREICKTELGI